MLAALGFFPHNAPGVGMNNWAGLAQPHLLLEMSFTRQQETIPGKGGEFGGPARLLWSSLVGEAA